MSFDLREFAIIFLITLAVFGAFRVAAKLSPPMPPAAALDPEARSELMGTR